jgi:AcrR family transcriptional regulator
MTVTTDAYHHGDLRRALVAAAERLLQQQGLNRISLRGIARAAGVSHAAPYHYFPDLDHLLAAVAANAFRRLTDAMLQRAVDPREPSLSRLQAAGVAYVKFAVQNAELYRLMFGGRLRAVRDDPALAQSSDAAYGALGELLAETHPAAAPAGAEITDPELSAAARAAWALVHGLSMLLIDGRLDVDPHDAGVVEELVRDVTSVLGTGLRHP